MAFELTKFTDGEIKKAAFARPASEDVSEDQEQDYNPVTRDYTSEFACLSIIGRDGRPLCLFDHFIMLTVNEPDQEKMSLVFDFGEATLFGGTERRPRLYSYGGALVDAEQTGKCVSEWKLLYDKYIRGTVCAELGAFARLTYRDQWRHGYITGARLSSTADRPLHTGLSFTMFVIDEGHF